MIPNKTIPLSAISHKEIPNEEIPRREKAKHRYDLATSTPHKVQHRDAGKLTIATRRVKRQEMGAGGEGLTTPPTASLPMTPHATGENLKTELHATGENLMTALDRATIGNHRAIAAAHRAIAAAIATRSAPSLPKREQRRRKLHRPNPTAHSLDSRKSRYTFWESTRRSGISASTPRDPFRRNSPTNNWE